MKNLLPILFIFLGIILGGTGAKMFFSDSENPLPSPKDSSDLYSMNVVVSHVPFWSESKVTWKELDDVYIDDFTFGGPTEVNSIKQIEEIETLIAQGLDGLVIAPTDSKALDGVINKAMSNDIPVVTFLVDAPNSNRLAYITSELENASKTIGEYAFKEKNPKGKAVILLGDIGSEEQKRRADGFKQLIENYPDLKLVDIIEDEFDATKGADKLKPVLTREGKVDFIFGCNSRSATAAKLALDEMQFQPEDVAITGWDYDEDLLGLIESKWVLASAAQQSGFMTQLAFNIIYAYENEFLYPENLDFESNNVKAFPDKIEIPIKIITQNNLNAYKRKK